MFIRQGCRRFIVAAGFCACFVGGNAARADGLDSTQGPNSVDPDALFPAGPFEFSHERYRRATEKFHEATSQVKALAAEDAAGTLRKKKGTLLEIGRAHTTVAQARRLAIELEIFREPASVDLQKRLNVLDERLGVLRGAVLTDPKLAEQVKRSEAKWLKDAEKLQNRLPQAEKHAQRGQWHESCQALYELLDELEPRGFWHDGLIRTAGLNPFLAALRTSEDAYQKKLLEESYSGLNKLAADLLSDLQSAAAEMEAASQSVAQGAPGALEGRQLEGAELVASVERRWRQARLLAFRGRAVYWRSRVGGKEDPIVLAKIEEAYRRVTAAALQSCVRSIEADAQHASPSDVAARHQRYLVELAPLVQLEMDPSLASGVERALEQLVGKSQDYALEVAAYRRATTDLLRWRERMAAAKAARLADEYRPLESVNAAAFEFAVPVAPGGKSPRGAPVSWIIDLPAPEAVKGAVDKLVGRRVAVSDVWAGGKDEPFAYGTYAVRCCGRLATSAGWADLADELKTCLLVRDGAPPLTLESQIAVDSAERRACVAAFGTVDSFEICALATWYAAAEAGLVRLGPLPAEKEPDFPLRECLIGVTVQPAAWQHRYGFVEVKH